MGRKRIFINANFFFALLDLGLLVLANRSCLDHEVIDHVPELDAIFNVKAALLSN